MTRLTSLVSLPDFGTPKLLPAPAFASLQSAQYEFLGEYKPKKDFYEASSFKGVDLIAAFRGPQRRRSDGVTDQRKALQSSVTESCDKQERENQELINCNRHQHLDQACVNTATFGSQESQTLRKKYGPPRNEIGSYYGMNLYDDDLYSEITRSQYFIERRRKGSSMTRMPKDQIPRGTSCMSSTAYEVVPQRYRDVRSRNSWHRGAKEAQHITRDSNPKWPYPLFPMVPAQTLLPASIQQPGFSSPHALSAVASRSLLTCNRDFQVQYPNVYSGLCKGLIDVHRLILHEVVIPVKEEISLHKEAVRSRRAVTAAVSDRLWKPLQGKFPDPLIGPKLVRKLSEYFFDKIEQGVKQAEDERSFLQWLLRFDVENAIEIRMTTSLAAGANSAIACIEGSANVKRKKGNLLSMLNPDFLTIDMDLIIKALFLNGGQLYEINNDPFFIDKVQAGENRFAASLINLY